MVVAPSFTEGESHCKIFTSGVSPTNGAGPEVSLWPCSVANPALSPPAFLDLHEAESRVLGQTSGDMGAALTF